MRKQARQLTIGAQEMHQITKFLVRGRGKISPKKEELLEEISNAYEMHHLDDTAFGLSGPGASVDDNLFYRQNMQNRRGPLTDVEGSSSDEATIKVSIRGEGYRGWLRNILRK